MCIEYRFWNKKCTHMLDVNIDTSIMYINRRCHASKITPIWHVDLRSQLLSCRVHSWNAIDCIINFVDLRLAQIKHDVSKKWMLWPPWWANSGPWPTKFSTHLFAIFPCMVNGPLLLFGFLLPHPLFYIKGGSKLWHYMAKACRAMSISISFLPPTTKEDIIQLNLWWSTNYHGLEFGITMDGAFVMYRKGLHQFKGI